MRVIAGRLGGRKLIAPRGRGTRPTSDRVREALFSMLGPLDGLTVLDLFAGTGALGIEALSRGATSAVFVEKDASALAALRRNLAALGLDRPATGPAAGLATRPGGEPPLVEVWQGDALAALDRATAAGEQYDLIFVDPPYAQAEGWAPRLDERLPLVLGKRARVVVESDHRAPLVLALPIERQRRYGDTSITIHRQNER